MSSQRPSAIVIGAGIGGLAAALRLADIGVDVTVLEAAGGPGGKMRCLPSAAGPVDAGPTVLTFRPVFEDLFSDVGERLDDHLTLTPLPVIARHFWSDGAVLDLMADHEATCANIETVFGAIAVDQFRRFSARAARLLEAFDGPMLQAGRPRQTDMLAVVAARPSLIADMAPARSMAGLLKAAFSEPKLGQLYARYATYVGGLPHRSPALLSLIAAGEANGVWAIEGGMHRLATTLQRLAEARGAVFRFADPVRRIAVQGGAASVVETDSGRFSADTVLFNGDPRALHEGALGPGVRNAVARSSVEPRSLSADVMAFAAEPSGPELSYHNVFFSDRVNAEFGPLDRGDVPADATLYLCAQDRAGAVPGGLERFEVIRNAAPIPDRQLEDDECQKLILNRFRSFGLTFAPTPATASLSTPATFHRLFPESQGSLYGRSPHGLTAGLKRPTARTSIPGLYLTGGGAHPGAGVPMATLSARHAVEAIRTDLSLTSLSRRTATPGGISTGSVPTAPAPSASSPS